jgi:hypothetical protein
MLQATYILIYHFMVILLCVVVADMHYLALLIIELHPPCSCPITQPV